MDGVCIRCGSEGKIEAHHIISRKDGGSDDPENLEDRCVPCHKHEHVLRNLTKDLSRETFFGQGDRIDMIWRRIIATIEQNTIDLIRERGTYRSYGENKELNAIPKWKLTQKERRPLWEAWHKQGEVKSAQKIAQ